MSMTHRFTGDATDSLVRGMTIFCLVKPVIILLVTYDSANGNIWNGCVQTQYVEHHERGILHCNFSEDYLAIYWYNIIDDREAEPVLTSDGNGKTGEGLKSGEFDIFPNGSLVINKVSLAHEQTFKVVCLFPNDRFLQYYIEVVVTVTPIKNVLQISNCSDTTELCIINYKPEFTLTCTVSGTRPASEVSWSKIVGGIEIPLNMAVRINSKTNGTFDSSAFIDIDSVSKGQLTHLICKSKLQQAVSWVLRDVIVDTLNKDFTGMLTSSPILSERGQRTELSCASTDKASMYVWRNADKNQIISYAVKKEDGVLLASEISGRYKVKPDGSLYIGNIAIEDEGRFICVSSDGTTENAISTELVVSVSPSPPYIVIRECAGRKCIVSFPETSSLTCSVSGVRPSVDLHWTIEEESHMILGKETQSTVLDDGLYSVATTISLDVTSLATCRDTAISCEATGTATYLFSPFRVVIIKVNCATGDHTHSPQSKVIHCEETSSAEGSLPIYLMVICSCLMAVAVILYVVFKLIQVAPIKICGWHLCNRWRSNKQLQYFERVQNLQPTSSSTI